MPNAELNDRIKLTGGSDFWHTPAIDADGVPAMMLSDGPHGVRMQPEGGDHAGLGESAPATCFPPAVGLASTWNPELARQVGTALGVEAKALGVQVLLGPGANIKRSPLCGRNFEYFSEDPVLTGELATAYVEGVQSQGVGTSLKHFAANNQETDRMRRDSQVDERTLREIYLRGFSEVVRRAQPWTVMCSYNKLNGVQVSEHRWLLTDVLRGEWGFQGVVVSDWGAVADRVLAIKAGCDLEMPANAFHEADVVQAAADGRISEDEINIAYHRIADLARKAAAGADPSGGFDVDAHNALARRAAEQAIVLLRNEPVDGTPLLPLAQGARVAVVGEFARTPRYQGAGSSRVNPTRLENALDALASSTVQVTFEPGFTTDVDAPAAPELAARAVAVARDADVVLAFLGLGEHHESEGYDRTTLDLPEDQLALLDLLVEVNPKVVVVLSNGSSVLLPFAHKVPAIVEGWLLGQAGGPALADVLTGAVTPSGKITETIPLRLADAPSFLHFPGDANGVRYGEGLFVGYRGYDAARLPVEYPFGHGLSYTTFEYGDASASSEDGGIRVEVQVTNSGARAGREVVQAYVSIPGSNVVRVPRELKGFASVELAPGESASVVIGIPRERLAFWSLRDGRWVIESGDYVVEVGSSSRDLRTRAVATVAGDEPARRLSLRSTVGEALADPVLAEELTELLKGTFGEGDGSLGVDMMRMAQDFPLYGVAGFGGQDPAQLQGMIDAANERMGV